MTPKETLAKLVVLGVKEARGLRCLPSGRIDIVFDSADAADQARASSSWIKSLDPGSSLYEKVFSIRVNGVEKGELAGFQGAEQALGANNCVDIFKIIQRVKGSKALLTLQLTSQEQANQLIDRGLFWEGMNVYYAFIPN